MECDCTAGFRRSDPWLFKSVTSCGPHRGGTSGCARSLRTIKPLVLLKREREREAKLRVKRSCIDWWTTAVLSVWWCKCHPVCPSHLHRAAGCCCCSISSCHMQRLLPFWHQSRAMTRLRPSSFGETPQVRTSGYQTAKCINDGLLWMTIPAREWSCDFSRALAILQRNVFFSLWFELMFSWGWGGIAFCWLSESTSQHVRLGCIFFISHLCALQYAQES